MKLSYFNQLNNSGGSMGRNIAFTYALMLFIFLGRAQGDFDDRINGISLVAERTALDTSEVEPLLSVGANWAAIIPFGFMEDPHQPRVVFNGKWQWYGERIEGARESIRALHKKGLSVMLKPQLWVAHGVYTGEVEMNAEKEWQKLESSYRTFIRAFAELARDEEVEMFCIGTEMTMFTRQRPDFWRKLIQEIRTIYSGKLTYAANWDEYTQVVFWDALDYIGVDAYFPIADTLVTNKATLQEGWKRWMEEMDSIGKKFQKKILFTEFGYRSIAECAIQPWEYRSSTQVNEGAQSLALEALFSVPWKSSFIVGGFLWKWHPDHANAGGKEDNSFTVQNKQAEEVVRSCYQNR